MQPILNAMARPFIDPGDEAPALRRAAVLLERVREDGGARDSELSLLQTGIVEMQRAASDGRAIQPSAIDRLTDVLARVAPQASCPRDASIEDLVRWNALAETRELLSRLSRVRSDSAARPHVRP